MCAEEQKSDACQARERRCQLLQAVIADAVVLDVQVSQRGEAAERRRERGGAGGTDAVVA